VRAKVQKRSKFQVRSDASKQRWVRDDRKEAFWRKQIADWKKSGLSKRAFCIQHVLSQSSFNAWCREIGIRDREKIPSTNAEMLLATPSEFPKTNPFVPLRLLADGEERAHVEAPAGAELDKAPETRQCVEIVVPGGAVIRVHEDSNLDLVGKIFSTLRGQ
jgi:hypothetical protein